MTFILDHSDEMSEENLKKTFKTQELYNLSTDCFYIKRGKNNKTGNFCWQHRRFLERFTKE